jgi:methylmalonyl-CoA carboxyltransferase 12S subunit
MLEVNTADLTTVLDQLRSEIRELSERLSRIESAAAQPAAAPPAPAPARPQPEAPPPQPAAAPEQPQADEPISEEIMLVISAAVAAFLGERAHVRQIRLIRSPIWSQQGRVSIQASHRLRR